MSDVFRRVGRGGAGNVVPQADKPNTAATTPAEGPVPAQVASQPQHYARVGRGGAGNFYDTTNAPEKSKQEAVERNGTDEAVNASYSKTGYMGRGGVGNWSDVPTQHEAESWKKKALESRVVADVDAGLAIPPKAHTSAPKEEKA